LKNEKILQLNDSTFSYGSLYDSLKLKVAQYKINGSAAIYLPIGGRAGVNGGAIISENIFENERYRIGGNKLLRGFDEESIWAGFYFIATIEYRYLLGQNSYFYLFMDGANVKDNIIGPTRDKNYLGFGAGMTFETKAGIFGISYALGKLLEPDNPIDFRSAKIHFGYVNHF